ncbi:phospholipase D family protein [Rossellomorea marisflavi]|uniref:phospholipase D family protein n=1 Tax=Rossellomorea marisflavi TaxID=189381 RepID=UPI0009A6F9E5|nr:phospholipase D family protein [Rossellomorea marisflavi]
MEAFFSTPGTSDSITFKIKEDIRNAKKHIYCAVCYWDDEDICDAIITSKAQLKKLVLNNGLPSTGVLDKLTKNSINMVFLGTSSHPYSNMHHKFIIIDDILWIGSFNFTLNAKERNYESMIRLEVVKKKESINKVIDTYKKEFNRIWRLGEYLKDVVQVGKGTCNSCKKVVANPFEHYLIDIIYSEGNLSDIVFFCSENITLYPSAESVFKCSVCGSNNAIISGNIKHIEELSNEYETIIDYRNYGATVCSKCFLDGNYR